MKNLAVLRKECGLSQQKLASDIGLARNTICQYESGNRVPDVSTLVLLADYFGVSTDYLLGRDGKNRSLKDKLQLPPARPFPQFSERHPTCSRRSVSSIQQRFTTSYPTKCANGRICLSMTLRLSLV